MAVPAWPFGKPVADQLGLMARRIVHDDVSVEVSWHTLLDGVEEPAELLRPVPRHALADTHVVCSRGYAARLAHGAWAATAECDPMPGSAIFHRCRAPGPGLVGRGKGQRYHEPCR